jgi:hypothetical protein
MGSSAASSVDTAGIRGRLTGLISALLFAITLSLYLLVPTAHYSFDAVAGGVLLNQWIALGHFAQLFHKYHILYLPLIALVEGALRTVGILVDPLNAAWIVNAFFAAGAATVYYLLALRFGIGRYLALVITAVFSLGYGLWYYATDGEAYTVSLFFLLLAFLLACGASASGRLLHACLAGVSLALAVDFHITCILALPAAALAVRPAGAPVLSGRAARQALALVLTTLVLAWAPYAAVSLARDRGDPISGLAATVSETIHPDYRDTLWWSASPANLANEWRSLADSLAPVRSRDVEASFPVLTHVTQAGLLLFSLLPLLLFLPGPPRRPRARWIVPLVWFIPSFLLFGSWAVGSDKYAAYLWAPLLLFAAASLERVTTGRALRGAILGAVTLLAAATVLCGYDVVRKQSAGETNPHLQRALAIAQCTSPEDLVIHSGRGDYQYQKVYLPYFALRQAMVLDARFDKERWTTQTALDSIASRIGAHLASGKRVFILGDVGDPSPERDQFEDLHGLERGALVRFFSIYRPTLATQNALLGRVWELHAP